MTVYELRWLNLVSDIMNVYGVDCADILIVLSSLKTALWPFYWGTCTVMRVVNLCRCRDVGGS